MGRDKKEKFIDNKKCILYEVENPTSILIQAIDEHDLYNGDGPHYFF